MTPESEKVQLLDGLVNLARKRESYESYLYIATKYVIVIVLFTMEKVSQEGFFVLHYKLITLHLCG